jgi:RHS repeat-associated protein
MFAWPIRLMAPNRIKGSVETPGGAARCTYTVASGGGTAMSDWDVLNLDSDPTPGDPDVLQKMAGRLREQAGLASHNTDRLRAIAGSGGGDLRMEGDYAPLFTGALEELPGELSKLARAYQGCGDALATYAGLLADVKTQSGTALRQGVDAEVQYQGALRQVQALLPPEREMLLLPRAELTDASIALATASWDDEAGKTQVRQAAVRGRAAAADRDRARVLALQAGKLHGDAAHTCAGAIKRALSSAGIKNKPWWEKAWNAVTAPFRSWNNFMSLARDVALVAGVAALFLTGPVGLVIMLVAVGAGALVFANTFDRFARGQASLGQLALNSLGLIPGGHGVIEVADLGRLGAALARGEGGKLVTAGLREFGGAMVARGRAATAFVLHGTGSARETLAGGYQFTKTAVSRVLGRDPIDLASGQVILTQVDVELPGLLAWSLGRTYMSSYRAGRWFGRAWSSTLDHRLEVDADGVCYVAPDGVLFAYPHVEPGRTALPADGPRLPLGHEEDGGYTVRDTATGLVLEFATVPPDTGGRGIVLPLAGMVDRNGHRIHIDYDDDGELAGLRHSGGYRLVFETAAGRVVAVSMAGTAGEPDRTIARYGYDAAGCLVEVVNSSGQALRFDYHPDGRLARWTDRNGTGYAYTYDATGRVIRTEGSEGYLNGTLAYDTDRHVTVQTDSLGHTTTFHFNDRMQLQRQVDQLGHVTTHSWDRYDRKLADTDPLGRTVRYGYDPAGNLAEVIQPDGTATTVEWNELRLPVTIVEPDGTRWQRAYDSRGNLTATIDPTGARTTVRYDEVGRPTAVTDPLGHTRTIQTDDAGLPVAVTDPLGGTTHYIRDSFGRVVRMTDPAGGVTGYTWTVEGQLASHTLPDGTTQRWTYDGEGNLVEHLDAAGLTTRTETGHFDLIAVQTTPDGARLEYTYDTELRLIAVTDPQGLEWRYDYDPTGRLIRQTDFNGRTTTYDYDAAGQLTATTNDSGDTIHITRDILGNIIEKRAGNEVTTFTYDAAGRMTRATNADSDCTFQRDALGRILTETRDGHTVTSTYDPLGQRIRRTTPSGAETVWDYDPNGLPHTLTATGGVLRFTHDAAGRETQRSLGTGGVLTHVWDTAGRILSQTITSGSPETAGLLQRRDYSYSPDGYLTDIDDLRTGITRYTLDPARRVTDVHGPHRQERYAYDPAGNITAATWSGPSGQPDGPDTAAQGSREYTGTLIRRAGTVCYEHDRQGRIILRQLSDKPGTWHYTWDADDRLTDVTTPDGHHWHYRYDPLGRRIAKERRGEDGGSVEKVTFSWDGAVLVEQIHTADHNAGQGGASTVTTWNHEPRSFRPLTQTEHHVADSEQVDTRFHAIITDSVGTPTDFVDPAGALGRHARTSLWGATDTTVASTSVRDDDVSCPLRFPGQYHDPETGLHYNYQRHYDPATGRYASADPLGLAPGPNPHAYVANPLEQFDPLGLAPCVPGAAGAGRARTVTIAHPPEGMIGATDEHGNIFIKPGLTRKRYRQTLRHETVHSILTPPAPFNKITLGLYKYSILYRWAEEGAAESYGTRNIAKGFVFPIVNGYLITGYSSFPRLAVETAAATAVVHEVYSWTK